MPSIQTQESAPRGPTGSPSSYDRESRRSLAPRHRHRGHRRRRGGGRDGRGHRHRRRRPARHAPSAASSARSPAASAAAIAGNEIAHVIDPEAEDRYWEEQLLLAPLRREELFLHPVPARVPLRRVGRRPGSRARRSRRSRPTCARAGATRTASRAWPGRKPATPSATPTTASSSCTRSAEGGPGAFGRDPRSDPARPPRIFDRPGVRAAPNNRMWPLTVRPLRKKE